jgi:hypothetical protein
MTMTTENKMVNRVRLADMTEDQARLYLYAARRALADGRRYLKELRERRGWRALGYGSWFAFKQGELGGEGERVDEDLGDLPPAA